MVFVLLMLSCHRSHPSVQKLKPYDLRCNAIIIMFESTSQLPVPSLSATQQFHNSNTAAFDQNNHKNVMATPANIKIVVTPASHEVTVRRADGILITVPLNSAPVVPGPSQVPLPETPIKKVLFADSELTRKEQDEIDEEDSAMLYGKPPKRVSAAKLKRARELVAKRLAALPEVAAFRAMEKGRRVGYQEARAAERSLGDCDW